MAPMTTRLKKFLLPLLLPILVGLLTVTARAGGAYQLIGSIPISTEGGWDYLTVDPAAQRLYVSHATRVVVIDTSSDQIIGEITNTPGVHGVALAPELGRGITSNGREDRASLVDLQTWQTLAKVPTAPGPDSLLYNPARQEAYLFCGRAQAATVVDVRGAKVVATIPLGGRPEAAAIDVRAGRVYDNLEDQNEIAVIDTASHTVVTNWPIAPGAGGSGLAVDVKHHRLFIGCGESKSLVMMDAQNGRVIASVPIGAGVDADAFDPGTKLVFASCGDGTTTIAHEDSPDRLTVVQTLATERSARTLALDVRTHRIYLATAKFTPPAPGQRRGTLIPGTLKILVYGRGP
jgi:DNA-binding beta-propeller fold protein YncE